jgi:hypothetical protein
LCLSGFTAEICMVLFEAVKRQKKIQ